MATQEITNGGLLYHEVQESKLCAVHCVNTVLQGPFFSEFDLASIAADLDHKEKQMMMEGGMESVDYLQYMAEGSSNVSMDGNFSIQVLEKALEIWDLHVIPLESPLAGQAQIDPQNEDGFICHLENHWFCIRKVGGEWYNFNSFYPAPEYLSKFYLSAYLDTLKGAGWSIFLVRGNFPRDCPVSSSETSNAYGQWLTPDDAQRITKTVAMTHNVSREKEKEPMSNISSAAEMTGGATSPINSSNNEESQLRAAIAASLGSQKVQSYYPDSFDRPFESLQNTLDYEDPELMAAIAASLKDSSTSGGGSSDNPFVAQSMQLLGQESELLPPVAANMEDSLPTTVTSGHTNDLQNEGTFTTTENKLPEEQDPASTTAMDIGVVENSSFSQDHTGNCQASHIAAPMLNVNSGHSNVSQLAAAMAASLANVQVPPRTGHPHDQG